MNTTTFRGRIVAGGVAISALALLIAGCSTSTPGATTTSAPAAALPAAATCTPDQTSANTFALGTFLPLTGSLATLGPAATAGSGLALSEINAAGGVNGKPACVISTDSSDASHDADISQPSIDKLIQSKVSAILGAESSSVTENVLSSKVDPAGIVMFSPANTDDALSGASKWFFRDAVPNRSEGAALGDQITADGVKNLAILVFQDAYGLNLRDQTEAEFEANGGTVTYGAKGKNQEFAPTETNFTSIVQSALATKPDAVFVDTFDQTQAVLTALQSAGFDLSKTYFDDGNLGDYSNTAGFPDITGAKGTLQGNAPTADWSNAATSWYTANEPGGSPIITWAYGPESYDAVTLMALAADVAGSSDPASIQANLLAVSGSTGGTACSTYSDCLKLIQGGNKNIWYQGPSAIGPLNDKHDPSTGYVTIYQAKGQNMQDSIVTAIKSTVSE